MQELGLTVTPQTELYLLDLDRRKLRNFCREHDFANMAKRKKSEHDKIRTHLEQAKRDRARNATYTARTGCEPDGEGSDEVRSALAVGVGGAAVGVGGDVGGAAKNQCMYAKFGCCGARKHKTNRSKLCKFYGVNHNEIIGETFLFSKCYYCTKILFVTLIILITVIFSTYSYSTKKSQSHDQQ